MTVLFVISPADIFPRHRCRYFLIPDNPETQSSASRSNATQECHYQLIKTFCRITWSLVGWSLVNLSIVGCIASLIKSHVITYHVWITTMNMIDKWMNMTYECDIMMNLNSIWTHNGNQLGMVQNTYSSVHLQSPILSFYLLGSRLLSASFYYRGIPAQIDQGLTSSCRRFRSKLLL